MEKKCIWISVVVVLVAALALSLGLVFGLAKDGPLAATTARPASSTSALDDLITKDAKFPDGSVIKPVDQFSEGSSSLKPGNVTESELILAGIRVDDTSFVAETGRLNFLYVLLPTANSRGKRQSGDLLDSVGVRFGEAKDLHIIPLSLASQLNSGLRLVRQLTGAESIYEIQVRMPESMCSEQSSCVTVSWTPYGISEAGSAASRGTAPNALPVACGSQCDTGSTSQCSRACATCDGEAVAGADTPVMRRYDTGTSNGSVDFQYNTYNVKDRITVVYEGRIIHDSGCVGDLSNTPVTFTGKSQEVRADVEPNCQGTTSTAWDFRLTCPDPREQGPQARVRLMNGGKEIRTGDKVCISKDAQMPSLVAHYLDKNGDILDWNYKIAAFSHTTGKKFCNESSISYAGAVWSMAYVMPFQGGDAVLSWNGRNNFRGSVSFQILGTQPIEADVTASIRTGSSLWYAVHIAKHETGLKQFGATGRPLITFDNGVGILQLTNSTPTCLQVWNWKENVHEGLKRLNAKAGEAKKWMDKQRNHARIQMNRDVPVPDRREGKCVLKENSAMVLEDAVALKMYNGGSCGNYCAWNNATKAWKFNPVGSLPGKPCGGHNYVNRICQDIDT